MVLTGFVSYLLIIVFIGWYSSKVASKDLGGYFLAGRNLNFFVTALSAVASGRSAWLLLGFTGIAYMQGASAIWAAIGYTVTELLLFLFFAPKFRRFTSSTDCITVPDYFAARFPKHSQILRLLLAVVIITFMTGYVSAQLVAGGKAFAATFEISENTGLYLTSLIILTYTVTGGYLAVSLTDMVQALFMLFALIFIPIVAISNAGGWHSFFSITFNQEFFNPYALGSGALIGFLGIGLGSPGSPHILVRYMSVNNPDKLKWSALTGTVWNILMAFGALCIGMAGRLYFQTPEDIPGADVERVFPLLAGELLHPLVYGFVIAAVFAAIMSTADSQLLVGASAIVRDLYEKSGHRKVLTQKQFVWLSRFVVLVLLLGSIIFGYLAEDIVFWLVLYSWAGLGATIGPAVLMSVFWEKTSGSGVIAGIITGAILVICWKEIPFFTQYIWNVYELVPAFLGSLFIIWLFSRFSRRDTII